MQTTRQIAETLGVSQATINRMVRTGRLKAQRVAGANIVSDKDAEEFIASYSPYDTLRVQKGDEK